MLHINKKNILFLFGILIIIILISIIKGSIKIPISELFSLDNRVILNLRLSRILLGIITGAGLGVCGVTLQAILRNSLADPYLLGTSSGAGLGSVLAIILGISNDFVPIIAFAGALISIILVYNLSKENGKIPVQSLILSGVIVGIAFSGIIVFLISISDNESIHGIIWWLLGSLQIYDIKILFIVGTIVLSGILWIYILAQDLNAISVGEEFAIHSGIEIEKIKKLLLLINALIIGALVSVSGMIGFVGLIIPHMMRLIVGPNHKILIPASCIGGAAFLVGCDMFARSLFPPVEIPIGVVTSLVGAPIFIILLKKGHKIK